MKEVKILITTLLLLAMNPILAQETFIIEGDTLQLQREVKGPLSLYWSLEQQTYRYFVQKNDRMVELRNTVVEGEDRKHYRQQLEQLTADTGMYAGDVSFVLYSLKHFVNRYNAKVQEDYTYNAASSNIKYRVGLFSGLSNNIYTENPENILAPVLGVELEFFDPNLAPRHSAFLHLRQSFKRDEYRYSSTQLSLNYRFKIFNFSQFDVHVDTELANFLYSEDVIHLKDETGNVVEIKDESGFSFTAPFSFGIGSDIKITDQHFITISYNDIVSIVLDSNGSFPIDITIGYKYNL